MRIFPIAHLHNVSDESARLRRNLQQQSVIAIQWLQGSATGQYHLALVEVLLGYLQIKMPSHFALLLRINPVAGNKRRQSMRHRLLH
jgi:hypothetical protein